VLDAQARAFGRGGQVAADRAGNHDRGADADRAEHPDRLVHPDRDEGAGADRAARGGRGDQRDLRDRGAADVTEPHRLARLEAQFPHAPVQFLVGLEFGDRLVAGLPEAARRDHDDGHPVVDTGHRDPAEHIREIPRRQHARRGGRVLARAFLEVQHDRRGSAGHAVDRDLTGVPGLAARCRERGGHDAVGVHHPDTDPGLLPARGDETALDRERADAGQDVAAVLPVRHDGLVHHDLKEQVVHVDPG
jgi:hypothetical protein